ncbi:hypothetical protein BDF19DRAFT_464450 [Syncephalis fuscata]|nr:hypothetical protein BDF19DRAFT_464450 [Syncephalis fuscata]
MEGKVCKLWVHNERFSSKEVIRPVENTRQPVAIPQPGGETRLFERRIIVVYEPPDPEITRKQPQLQISLTNHMTTTFGLPNWSDVTVLPVESDAATAEFVLLTFRDQYLGRNDMWRLRLSLIGKSVYISQRVLFAGCIRAQVSDIYINGRPAASALIGESTRVIFRSESAKFFILIQMSKEMWEFDDDGQLFYEKVTHQFLPELFKRWKSISANHVVCIVLFTRIYYDFMEPDFTPFDWETRNDWSQVLPTLKREQTEFKRAVLTRDTSSYTAAIGTISTARDGNILEAIGLALNTFDRHYVDRDLLRTGQAIMVLTPGAGYFEVDKKLLRLTAERMFDSGIALDLVCLDQIPLHAAPLFKFKSGKPISNLGNIKDGSVMHKMDPLQYDEMTSDNTKQIYYAWPHWIVVSFYGRKRPKLQTSRLKALKYSNRFMPTCRIPGAQTFNLLASDIILGAPRYLTDSEEEEEEEEEGRRGGRGGGRQSKARRRVKKQQLANDGRNTDTASIKKTSKGNQVELALKMDKADQYDKNVFKSIQRVRLVFPSSWYTGRRRGSQALPQNSHPRFKYEASLSGHQTSEDITSRIRSPLSRSAPRIGWADLTRPRRPSSPRAYHRSDDGPGLLNTGTATSATAIPTINTDIAPINPTNSTTAAIMMTRPRRISTEDDIHTSHLDVSDDDGLFPSSSTVQPIQINPESTLTHHRFRSNVTTNHRHRHGSPQTSLSNSPSRLSRSVEINQQQQQQQTSQQQQSQQSQQQQSQQSSQQQPPLPHQHHRSSPNRPYSQLVKQTLLNPSRALHGSIRQNDHLRRWEHIYPVVRPLTLDMDWTSLCTPACLPIGTDVFPTPAELAEQYKNMFIPVIAQRLSQGFQLIDAGLMKQPQHRSSGAFLASNINDAMKTSLLHGGLTSYTEARTSPLLPSLPLASSSSSLISAQPSATTTTTTNTSTSNHWRLPFELGRKAHELYKTPTATSTANTVNSTTTSINSATNSAITSNALSSFAATAHYLSMGHHIHRLVYDPVNRNVEVKRYVRKLDYSPDPITYRFAVWPKAQDGFESKSVKFNYPQVSLYNWNYLDHLVAGYQEEMTESLRFWRTRFILIPMETVVTNTHTLTSTTTSDDNLNEEEMRLNGFTRFLEQFERVRWSSTRVQAPNSDKRTRRQPINSLGISLTTFSTTSYLENEARTRSNHQSETAQQHQHQSYSRRASLLATDTLSKDAKLTSIAVAIKDPASGVRMQDRWWHLRLFQDVFLGNELVDWLLRVFDQIDTRAEAVEFGNQLMDAGLFEHCTHRHRLLDGHYFYRLQDDYAPPPSNSTRGWLQRAMRILPSETIPETASIANSLHSTNSHNNSGGNSAFNSVASSFKGPYPVELSRRMMINLDTQQWSDRQETAILHYDVVHNPRNCYHFQLNWLGCTAHLIEDLLQSWARTAEKCGLRLVEAPVDQERPDADDNPFQSPVEINLAIAPPSTIELKKRLPVSVAVPDTFFEVELAKHFGFILDVEADTSIPSDIQVIYSYHHNPYRYAQYVHQSGVAFIMVCKEPHSYLWVNNRLYTSHVYHQQQQQQQQQHQHLSGSLLSGSSRISSSSSMAYPDPDKLRQEFVAFCQNKQRLQEFWNHTIDTLLATSDVEAITTDGPERIQAPDILDSRDVVLARTKE